MQGLVDSDDDSTPSTSDRDERVPVKNVVANLDEDGRYAIPMVQAQLSINRSRLKKHNSDYASSTTETKSNNRKFSKNASLSHNKSKTSTGTSYVDKVFNKTGIKYTT